MCDRPSGDRLRAEACIEGLDAAGLRAWLRQHAAVDCTVSTCQTWRTRVWNTGSIVLSTAQVEEALGERLRLPRYASMFNAAQAANLASELRQSVPPVEVEPALLLRWHAAYHPDSGPLQARTPEEM